MSKVGALPFDGRILAIEKIKTKQFNLDNSNKCVQKLCNVLIYSKNRIIEQIIKVKNFSY